MHVQQTSLSIGGEVTEAIFRSLFPSEVELKLLFSTWLEDLTIVVKIWYSWPWGDILIHPYRSTLLKHHTYSEAPIRQQETEMWLQDTRSSHVGKWHFLPGTGWLMHHLRNLWRVFHLLAMFIHCQLEAQKAKIRHIHFLNFGSRGSTKHCHLCIY